MKKISIIMIIILLISVFLNIINIDEQHLNTCKDEHCIKCIMINNAIRFIKTISVKFINPLAIILTMMLSLYVCNYQEKNKQTLLDRKVQFNE